MTEATGLSLMPEPSPSEFRERMLAKLARMRESNAYVRLLPMAKAVIEHIGETVILGPEQNGDILRSKKDWMRALGGRSSGLDKQGYCGGCGFRPVDGSQTNSDPHAQGWQTELPHGLKCLSTGKTSERPKPRPKPQKDGLNPKQPTEIVEPKMELYAGVGDYPPFERAERAARHSGDG